MTMIRGSLAKLKNSKAIQLLNRWKVPHLLVPAAVIAFVYRQGHKEFKSIDWRTTLHSIREMNTSSLALLLAFAFLSVAAIGGYDLIVRRHFRLPIPAGTIFRYAWIANTSNSVIGFAGIAGAGLRTVLYRKWDIPMPTIAASIAFLSTMTISGLSVMAWAGLFGWLPMGSVLRVHPWIRWVVWGDALILPGLLLLQRSRLLAKWFRRQEKSPMDWGTIGTTVGLSVLEWLMAGMTFWLTANLLLPGLPLSEGLGVFTVAAITGLVCMAPGGIGGFDLTALLGLHLLGHSSGVAAAVLVLFRLSYYLIPWLVGLVMAAVEFTLLGRRKPETVGAPDLGYVLNPWQRLWSGPEQGRAIGEIGAWSLGKLVFASGFVLLLSAATPRLLIRLRFAEELLSTPLLRLSHQLSVVIGLLLIVLSWGITHRVKPAFGWTIALLAAGSIFTFTKAFDYEEALFLLGVCLMLWVSRRHFYRASSPYGAEHAARWGFVTLVIAFAYIYVGIGTRPGLLNAVGPWPSTASQFAVTAVMALSVCWLVLVMVLLFRPMRRIGTGRSIFAALGGKVHIPYTRRKGRLIVVGEPEGDPRHIGKAMEDFRRFADRYSLTVEFGEFGAAAEEEDNGNV